MDSHDIPDIDDLPIVVIGFLILFTPALTLVVLLVLLDTFRGLLAGELSTIELVELYLAELVVFAAFSYLLYRLGVYGVRKT